MKKRKDGRWARSVTIDGKRVFFYSTAKNERQANIDINRQIAAYHQNAERGKTFKEVADEWEEEHFKNLATQTEQSYKAFKEYAVDYFGDMNIDHIDSSEVDRFIIYRAKKGFCPCTPATKKVFVLAK